MKEALYYQKTEDDKVQCFLCPHQCKISEGKRGICRVRKNVEGRLIAETYGKLIAINQDPIEKKPLYHFYPGSQILSVGSIGCSFHCDFCQNCDISQSSVDDSPFLKNYSIDDIVQTAANRRDNLGIAYTYNEPGVWYEFMLDTAKEAKKHDLKNVMVTNGFINQEPLAELLPYMDAFNVDLKAFREEFYRKYVKGRLEPVKESLKQIRASGKHLEVTNLVIPTLNDNASTFREMLQWIRDELGEHTVMHLSRYFPAYKMTIEGTPVLKLEEFYKIAREYLKFVYLGNVMLSEGANTYCDQCGHLVIKRHYYQTEMPGIDEKGRCKYCQNQILY